MISWMNPQQYQMWAARPAPSGWAGSWPPQAPTGYPGPPPPPQGIDPTVWYGGQWQFNPMYRGNVTAAVTSQAWAPHPGWSQAAPGFNPYKRVPKPASADYWNTKLVDNPLGLENMHIRNEDARDPKFGPNGELVPQTPWIWAPKDLRKSPELHDSSRDPHDANGDRGKQDNYSSHHHDRHRQPQRSQTFPAIQSSSAQPPGDDQSRSGASYSTYPNGSSTAQASASQRRRSGSTSQYDKALPSAPAASHSQYPQQPQQPTPDSRYGSQMQQQQSQARNARSSTQSSSTSTSTPQRPSDQRQQERGYSTQQELQTTFSPKIVRTPMHYVSTASAAAAAGANLSTPSRGGRDDNATSPPRSNSLPTPGHGHGAIYGPSGPSPTPARSNPMSNYTLEAGYSSRRHSSQSSSESTTPSSRSSHSSSSSSNSTPGTLLLQGFSDEPAGVLSPLVVSTPAPTEHHEHQHEHHPSNPRSRTSPATATNSSASQSSSSSRDISRSQTYPLMSSAAAVFPTIPEDRATSSASSSSSSTTAASRTPQQTSPYPPLTPYSHDRSSGSYSHRSPGDARGNSISRSHTYPSLNPSPNSSSTSSSSMSSPLPSPNLPRSRGASPPRGRLSNPLPAPPRDMYSSAMIGASAESSIRYAEEQARAKAQQGQTSRSQTQVQHNGTSSHPSYPSSHSHTAMPSASSTAAVYPSSHSHTSSSSYSQPQSQSQQAASRAPGPYPQLPPPQSQPQSQHQSHPSHTPFHSSTQPVYPSSQSSYPSGASRTSGPAATNTTTTPTRPTGITSTSTASAQAQSHSQPQSQQPYKKLRAGYWNRRGDHLLVFPPAQGHQNKFIVYAPRLQANPPELANYPAPTEGFMDHTGHVIKYDGSIPEYSDSLPLHGEPPVRPYESFVEYYRVPIR